ncbi:hypothetical protein GC170_14570 [bacterium]|nr:hypothetical protein [bacterium]
MQWKNTTFPPSSTPPSTRGWWWRLARSRCCGGRWPCCERFAPQDTRRVGTGRLQLKHESKNWKARRQMSDDTLKPCPFCGCPASTHRDSLPIGCYGFAYKTGCVVCGIFVSVRFGEYETNEVEDKCRLESIKRWNKRKGGDE